MNYQKNKQKFGKKTKNGDKKEFDGESAYNEKYLKAKKNLYNGKLNTKFHNIKTPKESSKFICLLIKLIDFVFRTGKKILSSSIFRRMQICC